MSVESLRPVPSISLVVPAYNESRNLPGVIPGMVETLRSLSPRVEIVIVDDGSRDETVAVIESLSRQYPEVVGIQLSRNFGKEAAITAGLHATRGEVVAIMMPMASTPTPCWGACCSCGARARRWSTPCASLATTRARCRHA